MTRITTALATAAVAAVLAAGTLAASTDTTAAAWNDTDTIVGSTIRTGQFSVSTLRQGLGYSTAANPSTFVPYSGDRIELDGDGGKDYRYRNTVLRTELDAQAAGTGVLGMRLTVTYHWGANGTPISLGTGNWADLETSATINQMAVPVRGALPGDKTIDVLLWPEGSALPQGWSGDVLRFSGAPGSLTIDLTVLNDGFRRSWALGATAGDGTAATNEVTVAMAPYGATGHVGWPAVSRKATLPILFNFYTWDAVRPASASVLQSADGAAMQYTPAAVHPAPAAPPASSPSDEAAAPGSGTPATPEVPSAEVLPEPSRPDATDPGTSADDDVEVSPAPVPTPDTGEDQHAVKPEDLPAVEAPQGDDPTPPDGDGLDTFAAPDEDTA